MNLVLFSPMGHKPTSAVLAAALLLSFATLPPARGETLPFERLDDLRGPYEGVGAAGDAFCHILLGRAGTWPICACWSSARMARSPLLGFGWRVPALESKFVPLDDRRWVFHQPDGFARVFVRTEREDGSELTGGKAWRATVRGDTVTVVADPQDGGPKARFSFSNGRLARMTCEEGEFDIIYAGRAASRITSHGKTLLEVVRKPDADDTVTFRFNGGRSQVVAELRPATTFSTATEVGTVRAGTDPCLAKISDQTGRVLATFEYGGSEDEAIFKANGKTWKWNPRSRFVTWHDGWIYSVGHPQNEWDEPSVTRSRADGKTETYHYDRKSGLQSQQLPDGTLRECKMFTSGPLAWKCAHWTKETKPDGSYVRTDFTYDETGHEFYRRTTRGNGDASAEQREELWFNAKGEPTRRRLNGEEAPLK